MRRRADDLARTPPFFKQKTAYEIGVRLVGSEMCIRDSLDNDIVKIFGEKITSLARAQNGLNDAVSYTHLTLPTTPYV